MSESKKDIILKKKIRLCLFSHHHSTRSGWTDLHHMGLYGLATVVGYRGDYISQPLAVYQSSSKWDVSSSDIHTLLQALNLLWLESNAHTLKSHGLTKAQITSAWSPQNLWAAEYSLPSFLSQTILAHYVRENLISNMFTPLYILELLQHLAHI